MDGVSVKKEDQLLMSLVHYFVTKENYAPIYVHGVQNEIWLENVDGPYRIIRINSSHIINEEQFKYDQYRINDILRQVKKKTMSFKVNALNINLNEESIEFPEGLKNIDNIKVNELSDFSENKDILSIFPKIKNESLRDTDGFELIFNVTRDINKKTEEDNKRYEKIFTPRKPVVTYVILGLCVLMYLATFIISFIQTRNIAVIDNPTLSAVNILGDTSREFIRSGEVWRLITYAFLHGSLIHIICNMYSLLIIGPQIESKFGKGRFIAIYLISAIAGALLSAGFSDAPTVGASGAIFGLLGSMVYFGIRFRLYLKDSLRTRIIPVILINLGIGFIVPGIDNWCHIGGLIAGFLATMALGIPDDEKKSDTINGTLLLFIFIAFACYIAFFR